MGIMRSSFSMEEKKMLNRVGLKTDNAELQNIADNLFLLNKTRQERNEMDTPGIRRLEKALLEGIPDDLRKALNIDVCGYIAGDLFNPTLI